MDIKIKVLDVGDGDAIIVQLNKNNENLVMVIDGGESKHYKTIVKPELQKTLIDANKKAPDIVVVTHYDSDHIGGLIPLVTDYIDDIKEVWVHRPPELNEKDFSIIKSFNPKNIVTSNSNHFSLEKSIQEKTSFSRSCIKLNSKFILESLRQLDTLIGIIPTSKIREVFYNYSYKRWPEIRVLGPTKSFYDNLFPRTMLLENLMLNEIKYNEDYTRLDEGLMKYRKLITYNINPCSHLKNDSTARLTSTNKASIIISIDEDKKKYLFTGDAGIDSFKAIPNWGKELENLYWLKIPHHGSDNNISQELIDKMKPKFAFNSGDKYQDDHVLECLRKNSSNVISTKSRGNLEFSNFKN